jgi:hypothetical protein
MNTGKISGYGWRPAWINDLQRGCLENGVNSGSPGRHLVEQALARLVEEVIDHEID